MGAFSPIGVGLKPANNLSDVTDSAVARTNLGLGASEVISVNGRSGAVTLANSDVGLGSVENTALSTWAGSANITTLGTIATGLWHGTLIGGTYGGTGVNNGSATITIGGNLAISGAFATTLTVTGNTAVTLPTSGTLATTAVTTLSSLATVGDVFNIGTSAGHTGTLNIGGGGANVAGDPGGSVYTVIPAGQFSYYVVASTYVLDFGANGLAINNGATPTAAGIGLTLGSGAALLPHVLGNTSAPGIAAGAGAGTSPTISIAGSDVAGKITLTTGTLPTGANAVVLTVTFNVAFSAAPYVVFCPVNASASVLSGVSMVYVTATTATFVLTSGTTALTAATQYIWNYHVIG